MNVFEDIKSPLSNENNLTKINETITSEKIQQGYALVSLVCRKRLLVHS